MQNKRALWLSIILSACAYAGFAIWAGVDQVIGFIGKIGIVGSVMVLILASTNLLLRFVRWQLYLRVLGHPLPALPSLRIYLAGFALTTSPGKIGEIVRNVLLLPMKVPGTIATAALFSERLADLTAVLLLSAVGVAIYPPALPIVIAITVVVIALFSVVSSHACTNFLAKFWKQNSVYSHIIQACQSSKRCNDRHILPATIPLSLVVWLVEAGAFYVILVLLGIDISFQKSLFISTFGLLVGAASMMPGGLGTSEGAMILILTLNGVPQPASVAATLIYRLFTLWFAVGVGGIAMLLSVRKQQLSSAS